MKNATKKFDLGTVLTVTTGRLLVKPSKDGNGIESLYAILKWMTRKDPCTHQLPRFGKECAPWLLRWFPELSVAEQRLPELEEHLKASGSVEPWLKSLGLPDYFEVQQIPPDDHTRKDPIKELEDMRGSPVNDVIIVQDQDRK